METEPIDIIDPKDGRVLYFSCDRFISEIGEGDCCFICGARPGSKVFDEEHVLPKWMVQRFGLGGDFLDLPLDRSASLRRYVVNCCKECNGRMGEVFETPLSRLQAQGYTAFTDAANKYPLRLFVWAALIFLKAQLRDKHNRVHLDERKGGGMIADSYAWNALHHLHCVARIFYTGCQLSRGALGSVLFLPARTGPGIPRFDYKDLHVAQAMQLRMDEIALFVVFNDGMTALNCFREAMNKLAAPLAPTQLREILARLAYFNLQIAERPKFSTRRDPKDGSLYIDVDRTGPFPMLPQDESKYGELLWACTQDLLRDHRADADLDLVKQGKVSFLFRPDGTFNTQ
jgi:hypothetical protein